MIANIASLNLYKIKIYSNFEDKENSKNLIEKIVILSRLLYNIKSLKDIVYIFINKYNMNEFMKLLPDLFIEYKEKGNIEDLLDILFNIILINDEYSYDRFIHLFGYASPVIRPIPLDKKQKWPLFGERLINGNINEEIYEYLTTISSRKKYLFT